MKYGRSAEELVKEVLRQSEKRHDLHAPTTALTIVPESTHGERGVFLSVKGEETYVINPLAHDQIGQFCGIDAKFYDRLLKDFPELLATNINTLIVNPKPKVDAKGNPVAVSKTRLLRTLDGKLRAFLSGGFRPLENIDLLATIIPIIKERGLDLHSCEITDRKLYMKVVSPELSRELARHGAALGDGGHTIVSVAYAAGTISNSELGCGSLSVQTGCYDKGCSNLATFGENSVRKYHSGNRIELADDAEAQVYITNETRAARDRATFLEVRDTVKAAFDPISFGKMMEKIEKTKEDAITGDAQKVVTVTTKRLGLNESEGKAILLDLLRGGEMSRFGLANAITRASQDCESYEAATKLERAGGALIELPRTEWHQLAKAA